MGIRPEDLRVANGSDPAGLCFDAVVEVVERLGSETLLDLQVGAQTMVAAVEPAVRAQHGDKLRLALRADRLHFFDDEGRSGGLRDCMINRRALIAIAASVGVATFAFGQDRSIVVASTTSTEDSGLFGYILPLFKAKTGIDVKVVAQGTGQALDTGRRGDADAVFVHAKAAEEKFLAEGFGVKRYPVMYNDFILVGPRERSGRHQRIA